MKGLTFTVSIIDRPQQVYEIEILLKKLKGERKKGKAFSINGSARFICFHCNSLLILFLSLLQKGRRKEALQSPEISLSDYSISATFLVIGQLYRLISLSFSLAVRVLFF